MLPDLIAGTIAGFAICGVGHPFDTLKVLNQTAPAKFPTMGSAFSSVVKNNGPAGLYKGVGSPMVGNGILNAIQFTIFSRLKNQFTNEGKDMTIPRISAAAALTGLVVALVEGPQDLFKTQTQAQMLDSGNKSAAPPKYKGTFDCAKVILKERGLAGAGQGLAATMCRNFVGVGAYYAGYEATRMKLAGKDRPVSALSPFEVLLAGGCGG
jgi:solute carrier family 25 (mitochondrial carnitine/acylcarnitine transporter), member 20/29